MSTTPKKAPESAADMQEWSTADAKARFAELVERAEQIPQVITRNGKRVAVLVGIQEWRLKTQRKGSLAEFLLASPLRDASMDLERLKDAPRDLEL